MNDLERISKDISGAVGVLLSNAHEIHAPYPADYLTITKDGFLTGLIRLQRLREWVDGLAKTHREESAPPGDEWVPRFRCAHVGCHGRHTSRLEACL